MIQQEGKIHGILFQGTLNSYSQVFFSNHVIFAWILAAVTFIDPWSGFAGLLSATIANVTAWAAGFNKEKIARGYYGFNSLLVGLGMGMYYNFTPEFLLVLIAASMFTLFLAIALEGIIGKYNLPYLSVPFILSIWLVILATRQFHYLQISERWVFSINDMYYLGGMTLVKLYEWFNNLPLHHSLVIYLRSLGAIFFQYHLFPGLVIAVGLILYSRIAFLLSLTGFYAAYLFYQAVGADLSVLSYTNIGFNFILTAIAIGGFFIIPSWYSFLWVILLTPLISMILTATTTVFDTYQLSIYSFPFNFMVLVFLYILKFRERHFSKPELVLYQQFSPEKNLYDQVNNKLRYDGGLLIRAVLPFWGEWTVTQGHDGRLTHLETWRHAWDFEIMGADGRSYRNPGLEPSDYHCYDKPVLAPADGWVEEVEDGIEDNPINQVNLEENWGNTIVIRHADHLFSSLSHLKKESIKVSRGDFIRKGDIIAHCGNSGRSPVPHLHFQFQATPQVGSNTIDYPVSHYLRRNGDRYQLQSSDRPAEGDSIRNIEQNHGLKKAFSFIPGHKVSLRVTSGPGQHEEILEWEVKADLYNNTFLNCGISGARAYFRTEDDMFYFTHYEGRKDAALFRFYLGCFKVIFGYYPNLGFTDTFPVYTLASGPARFLQDFIAPFYRFMQSEFRMEYDQLGDGLGEEAFVLRSAASIEAFGKPLDTWTFVTETSGESILSIKCSQNGKQQMEIQWLRK